MARGSHPDLTWVTPSGAAEMLVADVAEPVVAAAARTPFESARRVFVIEEAHTLNDQAANRMLKTLEEPPDFVHLLLLTDRPHEVLVRKTQQKWSAQEHAGHLLDLETLWLARVDDYVAAKDQLTAADLTNRKTHEANHNQRPLEQILAEFRAARESLLHRTDELDASLFARSIPHPRLKTPMRLDL